MFRVRIRHSAGMVGVRGRGREFNVLERHKIKFVFVCVCVCVSVCVGG